MQSIPTSENLLKSNEKVTEQKDSVSPLSRHTSRPNFFEAAYQLKKSAIAKFGRINIDFNKNQVNLSNNDDQNILKKDLRSKKELCFIDRAVGQLKFFAEKKNQLNDKLYSLLLEKLNYKYIEKEKPLFLHGDKGDMYYIVLKGSLALLLPQKHFEEQVTIEESVVKKLQEKYLRVKEFEESLKKTSSTTDKQQKFDGSPKTSKMAQIIYAKLKTPATALRFFNTALKFNRDVEKDEQAKHGLNSPSNNQVNSTENFYAKYQQGNPLRKGSENGKIVINTTFDLYCSAFFPEYQKVAEFHQGTGFGEIALIQNTQRTGTVVTKEDSHLITLDKASFDEVLGCWEREKTDDQLNFLRSFHFLKDLNSKILMGLLHAIKMVLLSRNDIIYSEDNSPDNVYLIKNGEIEFSCLSNPHETKELENSDSIKKRESGENQIEESYYKHGNNLEGNRKRFKFSVLSEYSYFGDEEILLEEPKRNHMAKVLSTKADLWIIEKKSFISILNQQRSLKRFKNQCESYQQMRQERFQKCSTVLKSDEQRSKMIKNQKICHERRRLSIGKPNSNEVSLEKMLLAPEEADNKNEEINTCRREQLGENYSSDQLIKYYSRNSFVNQLTEANVSNELILDQIQRKSIGKCMFSSNQVKNQDKSKYKEQTNEELQIVSSSKRLKPYLPFQKNLLYQPLLGDGSYRSACRDPFQEYDIKKESSSPPTANQNQRLPQQDKFTSQIQSARNISLNESLLNQTSKDRFTAGRRSSLNPKNIKHIELNAKIRSDEELIQKDQSLNNSTLSTQNGFQHQKRDMKETLSRSKFKEISKECDSYQQKKKDQQRDSKEGNKIKDEYFITRTAFSYPDKEKFQESRQVSSENFETYYYQKKDLFIQKLSQTNRDVTFPKIQYGQRDQESPSNNAISCIDLNSSDYSFNTSSGLFFKQIHGDNKQQLQQFRKSADSPERNLMSLSPIKNPKNIHMEKMRKLNSTKNSQTPYLFRKTLKAYSHSNKPNCSPKQLGLQIQDSPQRFRRQQMEIDSNYDEGMFQARRMASQIQKNSPLNSHRKQTHIFESEI